MKLLLVEDNPADARLIREMLKEAPPGSFELKLADRLDQALAEIEKEKPDVVLLDLGLPDSQGLATLTTAQRACPAMPFVVLTGLNDQSFAVEAMRGGAQDYLVKGRINGELLMRTANYAFERQHLVAKLEGRNLELTQLTSDLQATQAQLRQLLAHSPAVIYALRVEGQNVIPYVVSENIHRLLGFTVEESCSFDWWAAQLHPEDRERAMACISETIEQGGSTTEYRIRHKEGHYLWLDDNRRLVRDADGKPFEIAGVWTDITQRKQAEERLAAHHAVTQALSESGTLTETAKKILQVICQKLQWDVGEFWTLDRTTRRLRCLEIWHPPSTEFNEFVTVSRQTTFAVGEGLPGRVCKSAQPIWVADVARESDLSTKSLLTRIGLHSAIAFPIRLRDETLAVIEFFSAKIRSPDDELLVMFTTVGSQIGQFIERKEVAEQFLQSQKMEAFGQLAGGVAHDFNNILAVIMGYTNMVMEEEHLSAELKEQLRQVYSAGERAANLTRQLLTFSRKKEMQVNSLDLNEVIADIIKMLGRIIGEDIKLQCNYASALPPMQADEGMMEQVLMNLAVNARDAMSKGGQLIIGTDRAAIDAAYVQNNPEARVGQFICLSVQDTGCGMTAEVKARIFEPFFTTKGVGKGTGLGLATVFGIVRQHQGWIEVESQVGVGTTFKVFLPASARSDVAVELAAAQAKVRGGKEIILLVEDELALRALTKIILQRHGYRVLEAGSGVEALEVWKKHGAEVDLLLTDMVMPDGLTGRELAKQLAALKPALKVIYVSGYDMQSKGTTFRVREASTFLQKPYQSQKLAQAVRDCLDGKLT